MKRKILNINSKFDLEKELSTKGHKLKSNKSSEGHIIGDIQEQFGNFDLCDNHDYFKLVSTKCKKTGFDGLYIDNNDVLCVYESKYLKTGSYSTLEKNALKTIYAKNEEARASELEDSHNSLINFANNNKYDFFKKEKIINNNNNLKNTIYILERLSGLISNDKTTKEEYEKAFKEFDDYNLLLYLGTKKQDANFPKNIDSKIKHVYLNIYSEGYDGKK